MKEYIEINNGSVDMIEFGFQEITLFKDGKEYILEFNTEERPNVSGFSSVEFANEKSEEIAVKIGFKIWIFVVSV